MIPRLGLINVTVNWTIVELAVELLRNSCSHAQFPGLNNLPGITASEIRKDIYLLIKVIY